MNPIRTFLLIIISGCIIAVIGSCTKVECPKPGSKKSTSSTPFTNLGLYNYSNLKSGTSEHLLDIFFTDANTGYVCGMNGVLLKTTDGGESFEPLSSGVTGQLAEIFFTDPSTGYTVGNNGVVLKTTNGGTNWTPLASFTQTNLRSVFFLNSSIGYVGGMYGELWKTTNAGVSWSSLYSGTGSAIYELNFLDENVGFATGQYGLFLKTNDGGNTWSPQSSPVSPYSTININDLFFINSTTGFAIGGDGNDTDPCVVLKTINGGKDWTAIKNPAGVNYLSSVGFIDANTGFISGGNVSGNTGTILKTTDGGETWVEEDISTTRLMALKVVKTASNLRLTSSIPNPANGGSTLYFVGLNGAIVKGAKVL